MTPYVNDADFQLYVGDALETLRKLPAESVDCVVTSPPYWGLRDYGTGEWEGGDQSCDHLDDSFNAIPRRDAPGGFQNSTSRGTQPSTQAPVRQFGGECGKCGARRVDQQLGLEPTPDQYVARMVEVFREVRRVLAKHGTCWVNLGDSYAQGSKGNSGELRPGDKQGTNAGSLATRRGSALGPNRTGGTNGFRKPKDLVGIPWLVAFALQADGWWLRAEIIWAKKNCMPESVTDRPTKAHEQVFLLTKAPKYFYDAEAIREPHNHDGRTVTEVVGRDGSIQHRNGERWPNAGRNSRSVWHIATQAFPDAHFATFPEELARRCILAGCPVRVCRVCGKPSERIVERSVFDQSSITTKRQEPGALRKDGDRNLGGQQYNKFKRVNPDRFVGWSDCGCLLSERVNREGGPEWGGPQAVRQDESSRGSKLPPPLVPRSESKYRPGVVLDPFLGSGTTALVARNHGRHAIGIELSAEYAELAAKRTRQLSLLAT